MEFPKGGLIGKCYTLWRKLREFHIPTHAANAGYFMVLSVLPALILALSCLQYTGLDGTALLGMLEGIVPAALLPAAEKLIVSAYAYRSGALVSVSAVTALWSASRGIYGVLMGLNTIYGVREDRGYFYTRLISVVYTFGFVLVMVLTLVLGLFGEALVERLPPPRGFLGFLLTEAVDWRVLVMLALQTGLFAAMYTVLPNRKNRLRGSLPGALAASVGWLVFTAIFSRYLESMAGNRHIYGSMYTLAVSMLWLYFCLIIFFFGGALNRLLTGKGHGGQP